MAMDFEVSLHKIMYPRNWRTFPDDMDLWISFRFVKGADDVSKDDEGSGGEGDSEIDTESGDEVGDEVGDEDGDEVGDMDVGVGDDASLGPECEGVPWRRVKLPNGCYTNAKDIFDMIMCEMRTTKRGGKFHDIAHNIEFKYLPATDKVYIISK